MSHSPERSVIHHTYSDDPTVQGICTKVQKLLPGYEAYKMTVTGDTRGVEVDTIESEGTRPQHYLPAVEVRTSEGVFQIDPPPPSRPKTPPPPPPDRPNKKARIGSTRKDSGGNRPIIVQSGSTKQDSGGSRPSDSSIEEARLFSALFDESKINHESRPNVRSGASWLEAASAAIPMTYYQR